MNHSITFGSWFLAPVVLLLGCFVTADLGSAATEATSRNDTMGPPADTATIGDGSSGNSGECVDPWSPTIDTDTDPAGLQYNQSIFQPIRMEVQQVGRQLEFRVCKVGSTFMYDVKVAIYDGATDSNVNAYEANLATAGHLCSSWVGLDNDSNYLEGDIFGGIWNVVSPSTSAAEWDTWGTCVVDGHPTGFCWSGTSITLTRTCSE